MKKILALSLALLMLFSLAACGKDKTDGQDTSSNNSQAENVNVDNTTLEGILNGITADFDSTTKKLTDELQKTFDTVGTTYDSYVKNEQAIKDWYSLVESEAEKLFENTADKAVTYYKLIASTIDHEDSGALDDAMDDFYDTVYEDAFDNFYDTIYEDSFDELYDKYYDGIIKDAQDTVDYGDWLDVRSDCYSDWLDARSDLYSDWLDARSDIYGDWLNVKSEFLYDDNFDVDDILEKKNTSSTTEGKTDDKNETSIPDNTASLNEEWRQFLKDYEKWVDDYIAIVKKYKDNPTDMSILSDYTEMVADLAEWSSRADEIELELEDTDAALEYSQELLRIAAKLAEATT